MNGLLLTLEVIYPNLETIKIKCTYYKLSYDKRTLYVYTYYDRFESIILIPRNFVINVFLLEKYNKKLAVF